MKKRPCILHVFDAFRAGGTEIRTCNIMNALGQAYRHVVISIRGDFAARALVDASIDVTYIHPQIEGGWRVSEFLRISGALKKLNPDLMVAYEYGAIDWVIVNAFKRVCPTLMAIEGFEESELLERSRKRELLRRLFYKRCNRVVACSENLCRIAIEGWKIPSWKILHIPNGVNCDVFRPVPDHEKESTGVALCIVASLIKIKNHARLFRAVAEVMKSILVTLYVAGDGPERGPLEQLAQTLSIQQHVRFMGHVSSPALVLQKMDVFCMASDTEQMPISVLEAMAIGLPVVSTDVGDVRAMVAEACKPFIVDKDDEVAYTQALRELCWDQSLRKEIGYENFRRCRAVYDEKVMVSAYKRLYDTLIV